MKIKELEIENFRNFYGSQVLKLSVSADKPITLILANNGFGKTSILNSIYWCLFGETLGDVEVLQLLNTRAAKENQNKVSVRIVFEDAGFEYEVKRILRIVFHAGGRASVDGCEFNMIRIEDGNSVPVPENRAQMIINKALPKQMAKLFIFEGEGRANQFLSPTNSEAIGRDLRRVIGAEEVSILIKDIEEILKSTQKALKQNSTNGDISGLSATIDSFNEKIDKGENDLKEWDKEITVNEAEISSLNDIIHGNKDAELHDQKRQTILKDIKSTEASIEQLGSRKTKWVRERCIFAVAQKAVNDAEDVIDDDKLHGKLPGDYQESFVQRLIDKEQCICGTPIMKGAREYHALMDCMGKGDNSYQIQSALSSKVAIQTLQSNYDPATDEILEIERDADRHGERLANLQLEFENVSRQLENVPVDKIKDANAKRDRLSRRNAELQRWTGDKTRKQKELKKERDEKQRDLERLLERAPATKSLQDEIGIYTALRDSADKWLYEHEACARKEIASMINTSLDRLGQGFEAYFDERFNLSTKQKSTGVEIQKNTGTGQLLALSFVSALIRFCEKRKQVSSEILTSGTIAPLVLDAPFGVLDEGVRRIVAQLLPQMAQQSVILVTDSQASVFKEASIRKTVGKAYAIVHESNHGNDDERKIFDFPNKRIEVRRNAPSERYFFEEVNI